MNKFNSQNFKLKLVRFLQQFSKAMSFLYIVMGGLMLIKNPFPDSISLVQSRITGGLLILYGFFRLWRLINQTKCNK